MGEGKRWLNRALAVAVLTFSVSGCPGAQPVNEPAPGAVFERYRAALVEGRLGEAFAYLHPDAREGLDLDGFKQLAARHLDALVARADALIAASRAGTPTLKATIATDRGEVEAIKTDAGWRLTAPIAQPTSR